VTNIFNKTKTPNVEADKHLNFMSGASYDISNPLVVLRIAASSCFFGEPKFYQQDAGDKRPAKAFVRPRANLSLEQIDYLRTTLDAIDPQAWRSMSPSEAMESAIDDALEFDAKATLEIAVGLRTIDNIRTTPQVILVRAAHHKKVKGTGLVRQYAKEIIARADEPSVGLAYHIWRFGKECPIPNSLKRAWADSLSKQSDYSLAKYHMNNRDVKTVDVVNLVHPSKSQAVGKLVKGELTTTNQTWESIISSEGSNTSSWTKAIDVMGHMALLRNVRNLIDKGVPHQLFIDKLVEGAKTGKQLPFRYYSAYSAVKEKGVSGAVLDAIESCLKTSLANVPHFKGKTMSLADNSGSAREATTSTMGTMKVSTIANLTSVIAGMVSDDGHVGVFGDDLKVLPIRKSSSVFDQLDKLEKLGDNVGQATENGIWMFWDKAITNEEHWDNVFIFSDMQAGHGGLYGTNPRQYSKFAWMNNTRNIDVSKLINHYRLKVNPNVNVFLVQVAGYQDTILPEFYKKTYILGGWGEGVLRFAAEMANMIG